MSCSVKISCGKNWAGSQRRIGSLAEEASACPASAVNCAGLQTVQPSATLNATSTSSSTSTTISPTTATVTVAFTNPIVITTGTSTITAATAAATTSINVIATGNQRVVPPRPVKSIAAKKGEDTTKLLKYIDDNVIGKNGTFFGPFGRRKDFKTVDHFLEIYSE
ncbi:hypothetical protein P5V15_008898 [Pogonomyrmex californicus]